MQIQVLVDKKKVIITETSVRSDLHLEDVEDEHVTTTSNDPLLSGENRLKLTELMELCTQLHSRVLALETTKANQALEIRSLKRRVKKLEKKSSKKSHKEDASKQGRMIEDLDADKGVALVDENHGRNDQDMFDTITTTGVEVSTVAITSQISMEEIILDKALFYINTSKPKAKGIVIQEPSETPSPTPIDSSQQPSKAKEKGKTKMIEPEKTFKKERSYYY
nr:hypothetical protein [Tanacetum cinerariifolium]